MAAEILPAGKLRPETLTQLLRHTSQAKELVVGPAVGEDAGAEHPLVIPRGRAAAPIARRQQSSYRQ